MKAKFFLSVVVMGLVLFSARLYAQVPQLINYQGKLTTSAGAPVTDTLQMVFSIYAVEVGGTALWTETQSAVEVLKGVFNVVLGDSAPIPYSVFDGSTRYLGVQVGGDPEITPRKKIVSVGYAYKSFETDTADYAKTAPSVPDSDWVIVGDNIYHLNGNVGIGTTTPGYPLEVKKASANIAVTSIENTDANGHGLAVRTTNTENTKLAFSTYNNTNTRYDFVVTNAGNVGIGTSSPGVNLDVLSNNPSFRLKASTGSPVINLDKASGGYAGYLEFREAGASKWQAGVSTDNNFYILNWPSSQYVFWANTTGNVGIRTTNPQRPLHISDVLRLEPRASAPSSPSEGDIYVNSTDHHIYCYLNGVWKQLD